MKHFLLLGAILVAFSMNGFSQQVDTLIRSFKSMNLDIPANKTSVHTILFRGNTFPYIATLVDVDLYLDIQHEALKDVMITLYSPHNQRATLIPFNSCLGQPVQHPQDIKVTLNDQAYDINFYNQTGQKIPANFTCTSANPSVGAYNLGHMRPRGDELKMFNGPYGLLGGQCNVSGGFTAGMNDINSATNRISNFSVQKFIQDVGLVPGHRILLTYKKATGGLLTGLKLNQVYMFQVLNNNTIEFLTITGSDITAVPPGSQHEFSYQQDWFLVVEDASAGGGGRINEVALQLAYMSGPCSIEEKNEDMGNLVPDQEAETRDELNDVPFIAFPNPFSDMLTVGRSADGLDGQLSIRSMDGRLIYGPVDGASIREVNTSGWSSGMYLAEWRDAREVRQVLVVKR